MTSSSRRGSNRETWTTALEDFTPSASPSPSSSETEDEEYGEIGASRRVTGSTGTSTDGSSGNMSRGLLSARAIAHGSASSDKDTRTADEPYAYGIPPSRRSSLLQQDAEPAAERSSFADRASGGGQRYGLDSPRPNRPSSRRQSSASSLLDDEAARTQRRVDREAKLRQMEEAVRIASGEAKSLMYGDGGLTTDESGASSQNTTSNPPAAESNAALLARGTREHLEEVKLTGGGNTNHGTKSSHGVQGSVSDRLKHLLPAYWNPNEDNHGDDQTKVAFPGSSLSTRSLTTPGRNLHDLANTSSSTSSSRIIGGGDGSSPGSQRQIKLANSGITLDFYDDYYHGSDDGISGGNKRGGASSLLSTLRDRATTVTDTVIGGRSSSHNNNGRRRLVMYVAAMAIVVGLAFHATGGSGGTAPTSSSSSNSAGSSSSSSLDSTLSSSTTSTFGVATTSSSASSGNGHQHSTHGDNSHSISTPNSPEAASIVIDEPDAPLHTPSSPTSISAEIVVEPGASSRFNAMKRRLIEEGITTVGNVHPDNSLTFGGGAISLQLHTYPSMQRRALQWLADEDNRRLAVNHPYLNQRFALACLWFSTFDYSRKKDTYGSPANAADLLHVDDEDNDASQPNWISTSNWMTPQPICSWHGVVCDRKGDVDGLVVTLALSDNGIRGYVPAELKRGLGEDVEVDMSGNHVSILKDTEGWQ